MQETLDPTAPILELVEAGEEVRATARSAEYQILVTDRRIAVTQDGRVTMDIPYGNLRRIQFDIEKSRPATLVMVPESPRDAPQVLPVPVEDYNDVALLLAEIGRLIAE